MSIAGSGDAWGEGRKMSKPIKRLTRKLIITNPPFPKVGDMLTLPGGSDWVVAKIVGDRITIKCPKRHRMIWFGSAFWVCEKCHTIYVQLMPRKQA